MKLATFTALNTGSQVQRVGLISENGQMLLDLQAANIACTGDTNSSFDNMISFLSGAEGARQAARSLAEKTDSDLWIPIKSVRLLAPVPKPLSLRDTMCYEDHYINCAKTGAIMQGKNPASLPPETFKPPKIWYDMPLFYKGNVNSVIGTGENVAFPEGEKFKDYELELAVYICKEGKNIHARDAMSYVGGYTILNDFSARMTQLKEMDKEFHLGPAIGKDFANAMGPCLVTPDAFNPNDALAVARVNGEVRGKSNVGQSYHKIADVIEYISNNTTLYPGDVIAMGTVPFGSGLEIGKPLRIGDIVDLDIEGIGVLSNTIIAPEVAKIRNRHSIYKRYVCAQLEGTSKFVIDDYPDITKSRFTDVWKVTEMPAGETSSSGHIDQGNATWAHEAPPNGSVFRHVEINPEVRTLPKLSELPPERRKMFVDLVQDTHREIGTHYIPTEQDMMKHMIMHRTDSINLFVCVDGLATSINDSDEIELQPGDAFVQLGCMHSWEYRGEPPIYIGGLLIDSDPSTATQLEHLPAPVLQSQLKRFKRYVSGTMRSAEKPIGISRVIINDFAPNEQELHDPLGNHIGWAGDIWRTFAPKADISGGKDTVDSPMEDRPPHQGCTMRMVELLPGATMTTNSSIVSYYTVIRGELTAISQEGQVQAGKAEHVVQLCSSMTLANRGQENVMFAHFMIDALPRN